MTTAQKKITLNPHYVSRLIGPLALASEMDSQSAVLESIDYADTLQRELVFNCLIRPSFDRLGESTTQEVKKSLGYLVENPGCLPELIAEKLSLCGVHPDEHNLFLCELWKALFPLEGTGDYSSGNCKIVNKPLAANQFAFSRPAGESLQDGLNKLYEMLLSQ
ncbi:hypothetical protein AAFN46_20290 [Pseudomonas sp. CAU 1711]|uniref:hypothetical protein n=1 Tax=Pseudomonas sp. CAU 1711 TaxID=3140356 RepID=UPI0032601B1A